jgi:predicted AAA+ superfamily ATPase
VLLKETISEVILSAPVLPPLKREVQRRVALDWPDAPANSALVLTGVRRSGKSTLQAQLRSREEGPSAFILFEDTRLYGLGPEDFSNVLAILREHFPGSGVYLDEVQEVPEWQRLVRALLDEGRRVCLTGSNASLLGREMGTKLTGRHLSQSIFPFSYQEYRTFTREAANVGSLEKFLRRGGFPGALQAGPEAGTMLLQELFRDVVQRDIVSRHALRGVRPIMTLAMHLLAHTGQPLSLQSLAKGLGLPSVAQTGRMVEYLQDAWLFLQVPRFSASHKQRVTSPPKYYPIDTGLTTACSPNSTPDIGRKLENVVLLALRRQGQEPTFAHAPHEWECDFVTPTQAIQVCAKLTPENRARELRGLTQAAVLPGTPNRKPRELLVITLDQEDALREEGHPITVIPAWRWLD